MSGRARTERTLGQVTVVLAFVANILVAIAKSVAAALTGSASLLAEAAHSWADAGNEIFLLIADRAPTRRRDGAHPMGYGRDAYIWSLFAAVGVFTAGAVVSVMHGVQSLFEEESDTDYTIGYVVLAVSFVLEGASLTQSLLQVRRDAKRYRREPLDYVVNSSNTTLRAVVAEDSAALIGLVLAFLGILLHQLTGQPVWDALGSIAIGVLLGGVALVLINRNRRFLLGAEPPAGVRDAVGRRLLERAEVTRVTYLRLEFVGPAQLFLVAAVDLLGDPAESQVAEELRTLSAAVEESELIVTAIFTPSMPGDESLVFG
ncbi:cation diffusion facilitator family transporter [Microbacteriaceae bacterium VKM Ac-2855]|nr:cation diffusion facilitator family transporter [Microbacteriaceae bacterium VKM Ac-2855]